MKRDMVLLQALLEYIEEHDKPGRTVRIDYRDFCATGEVVLYHLRLMEQAAFILCESFRGASFTALPIVKELTWVGHEYLDSLRAKV